MKRPSAAAAAQISKRLRPAAQPRTVAARAPIVGPGAVHLGQGSYVAYQQRAFSADQSNRLFQELQVEVHPPANLLLTAVAAFLKDVAAIELFHKPSYSC